MRRSFDEALAEARRYEEGFASLLAERDYYVIPTYDYSGAGDGKAPKAKAPPGAEDLILPDLQGFKDGQLRWFEVKFKSHATVNRTRGYRVTGLCRRLWRHYGQVQVVTGAPVYLAFLHEHEKEVRGATLDVLAKPPIFSHEVERNFGQHGGVFFAYDAIPRWGSLAMVLSRLGRTERAA
jgi:hypothetical protein